MPTELIYLWCENYHNIHNCGFSFSHDWIVDYRKETKELFIHRNHLNKRVNPYPNYISNVTAIIGKNGTGKSSLLDILGWQFSDFQFEYASFFQVYHLGKNEFLINLFSQGNGAYVFANPDKDTEGEISNKGTYESVLITNIENDPINGHLKFTRQIIVKLNEKTRTLSYKNEIDNKIFAFPKKRPLIPIQYFFPKEEIKINSEFHTPGDYIIDRFKVSECGFEDKYRFFCQYGNHHKKVCGGLLYGNVYFEIKRPFNYNENSLEGLLKREEFRYFWGEEIPQINYQPKEGEIPHLTDIVKHMSPKSECLISFLQYFLGIIMSYLSSEVKIKDIQRKKGDDFGDYLYGLLRDAEIIDKQYQKGKRDGIEGYFHFCQIIDAFRKLPDDFFDILSIDIPTDEWKECTNDLFKLFDNFTRITDPTLNRINYNWCGMSDGEEQFVDVMNSLISVINSANGLRHGIILLDEVDNKMHPETARRFLATLIDTLGLTKVANGKGTYQIIFVSHSPLLISDVPSDSVLLLQKDNNGECRVSSPEVETFGSNIHELLATSFFMDRTMGLFAERYISSLSKEISNWGDKLSSKTDVQYKADEFAIKIQQFHERIDLIGEPVIRQLLEEKLEEQVMKRTKTQKKISKGFIRDLVQKLQEFQDKS
jgi:AAA15 family ATPase/GTPase